MEYLFPHATPYEIVNNMLYKLSYSIIRSMDKSEKDFQKQISQMITKSKCFYIISNHFLIFGLIVLKLILYMHDKNSNE